MMKVCALTIYLLADDDDDEYLLESCSCLIEHSSAYCGFLSGETFLYSIRSMSIYIYIENLLIKSLETREKAN